MPNTKTVSSIQAQTPLTGTTGLLVSTVPCKIFGLVGTVNGTTGTPYYIQFHGVSNPTSTSAVPMYSVQVVAASVATGVTGFDIQFPTGIDSSNFQYPVGAVLTAGQNTLPIYAFISSTDTVFTSVVASTDLEATIEQSEQDFSTATVTGDLTTNVANLTVFSDPNAAKRLVQFSAKNNTGTDAWIMLFAYTGAITGALPLQQWPVSNGATITQSFGNFGFLVQQQGKADNTGNLPANYTLHTGCYLVASSTTQYLTTVANGWNIKAWNI